MQDEITQTHVMLIPVINRFRLAKHLAHKVAHLAVQKFWLVLLTTVFMTITFYLTNEIRKPHYQTGFSFVLTDPTAELTGAEFNETKLTRRDEVLRRTFSELKSETTLKRLLQHQRVANALATENNAKPTSSNAALLERLSSAISLVEDKTPQTYQLIIEDYNPRLAHAIANALPQIHNDQIQRRRTSPQNHGTSGFERHRRHAQARFALLDKAPRELSFNRHLAANARETTIQKPGQQERMAALASEIQALQLLIDAPENSAIENVTDNEIVSIYRDIVVNKVRLQALLKTKTATTKESNLLRRHITSLSVKLSGLAQARLIEKRAQIVGLADLNHDIATGLSFVKPVFTTDEVIKLAGSAHKNLSALSRITPLSEAVLPQNPISPDKKQGLIIGLVGGFFLGVILASLVGFKDEKMTEIEDLENEFDLPILGILPRNTEAGA